MTEAAQIERSLEELTATVNADPKDLQSRYELAMLHAAAGRFDEALEQLLQLVIRDRTFRDDIGRIAMIRIYEVIGPQSDAADEWRAKMGRAMY